MKTNFLIVILSFFVFTSSTYSSTNSFFVTEYGSGSRNGLDLSNSWSVRDFNDSQNWTSYYDYKRIGPGDNVYFYGSIHSQLVIPSSGSLGKPIILDGKNSNRIGVLNSTTGSIRIVDKSHFIIQNFSFNINQKTGSTNRFGINISGSSNHITIDKNNFTLCGTGVNITGNVKNVLITRNNFYELNGRGISTINSGKDRPSFITIGGHSGFGNRFYNVGVFNSNNPYVVNPFIGADQTSHLVISYNFGYNDKIDYGQLAVYGNELTYTLIEKNIFHSFHANRHRSAISLKADQLACVKAGPYIIRYNHLWNSHSDDKSWGTSSSAINVSYDWDNVYIYGNYVHNSGMGIAAGISFETTPKGCGGEPFYKDGVNCGNLYVFGNVISDVQSSGIDAAYGRSGGDKIENAYIFNNTIYRAGTLDCTVGHGYESCPFVHSASIGSNISGSQIVNHSYFNNLIINSRPNRKDFIAYRIKLGTNSLYDYNHYFDHSSDAIKVQIEKNGRYGTYAWDSLTRPDGGKNDTVGDPKLNNLEKMDFRLTENSNEVIGKGKRIGIGNITTVKIQNTDYSIPWGFALGPKTVFHETDPDKIFIDSVDRNDLGWNRGAYSLPKNDSEIPKVKNVEISSKPF